MKGKFYEKWQRGDIYNGRPCLQSHLENKTCATVSAVLAGIVDLTVLSGILFARFCTVECINIS